MHVLLMLCADCKRETPDTEGDVHNTFGMDFELCESCAQSWDLYGIPARIAADHLG